MIRNKKLVQLGSMAGLNTQFDLAVLDGKELHPGEFPEKFGCRVKR
jgi:hypothetical protein